MIEVEDLYAPDSSSSSETFQKLWEVGQVHHWKSTQLRDSRLISDNPASLVRCCSQQLLSSI